MQYRIYDSMEKTWVKDNIYLAPDGILYEKRKSFFGITKLNIIDNIHRYIIHKAIKLYDKNYDYIYEGDLLEAQVEEDKKIREMADVKNEADSLINSTEKSLKDYGDKLSSDEKSKVEAALSKLKEEKEKNNIEELKKALDDAKQASYIIGQKMYESQQTNQSANTAPNSGTSDDVEYEVKDE